MAQALQFKTFHMGVEETSGARPYLQMIKSAVRDFLDDGALKLAADLASWLPLEAAPPHPERPPRYAAWLASLAPRTDESFADYWRRTTQRDLEQAAKDEEPLRERS